MIGVSLPFAWLLKEGHPYGPRAPFLAKLAALGVESAELRTLRPDTDPEEALQAAQALWSAGFRVTVHGAARSAETAVQDIFGPLEGILGCLRQNELIITLHPVTGDNAAMLTALADKIETEGLPVRIALENNRRMPDGSEGDSVALVTAAVTAVDRPSIGINFDMGHYFWKVGGDASALPSAEFLSRVIHTHIHALVNGVTHFPLTAGNLPLAHYVKAFARGYYTAFNVELEPERWLDYFDPAEALTGSVEVLKQALPKFTFRYDEVRRSFLPKNAEGWAALTEAPGDGVLLLQSSSYFLKTGGVLWAMDTALRDTARLAPTETFTRRLLEEAACEVVTHGHDDHFEPGFARFVSDLPMNWVVPDFMRAEVRAAGVREDRLLTAVPGRPVELTYVRLLPFEGRHFRPGTRKGVPETGYLAELPSGQRWLFPGDVRDYDPAGFPDLGPVDVLFQHVWLGDDNTDMETVQAKMEEAAGFAAAFAPKTVILAHLYEIGREDEGMWRREHAEALAAKIRSLLPEARVLIPDMGDFIPLK